MANLARRLGSWLDHAASSFRLSTLGDRHALVSFMFHAVSEDSGLRAMDEVVDPTLSLSTDALDTFISYFLEHGYTFVSPPEVESGLAGAGRSVLLTFDDGYYNNTQIQPLLAEYEIPATIFISTNHVTHGRAFWWDVVYRERRRAGVAFEAIRGEQAWLKSQTHDRIERYLVEEFGSMALEPAGDDDRPMTPDELKDLARNPRIFLGNHTADHVILTNYPREAVENQIRSAQGSLRGLTGMSPSIVAYPNGNWSPLVLEVVQACGLKVGLTTRPHSNPLPLRASHMLRLGRYSLARGFDAERVFVEARSGFSLRRLARGHATTRPA